MAMNYVPLAEGVLRLTVQLYRTTASQTSVVQKEVAYDIVKVSFQRFSFVLLYSYTGNPNVVHESIINRFSFSRNQNTLIVAA